MPAVGSDWTDDQIDALVEYTKTLVKRHERQVAANAETPVVPPTAPTGAAAASPRG